MNFQLIFGLACIVIFGIGILIGQGLNGRAQIDHDKRRANTQRDLNELKRHLEITARLAHGSPSNE